MTFSGVERRLSLYLRALWGREIRLRPLGRGNALPAVQRPTLDGNVVWLPQSFFGPAGRDGLALCRAATAHAAAHVVFTKRPFRPAGLSPAQVALVSLIEDARVERLAMNQFPGLKRLWVQFHRSCSGEAPVGASLMARLSRALIDENCEDGDPWVAKARRLFFEERNRWADQSISRAIGSLLGRDLERLRLDSEAGSQAIGLRYRDDNAGLWERVKPGRSGEDSDAFLRRGQSGDGGSADPAGDGDQDDSAAPWSHTSPFSKVTGGERFDKASLSAPIRYDEWDYLIGRDRPAWCTLREKSAAEGDARRIDAVLERNHDLVRRVKHLVQAVQVRRPVRLKRRLDGDRLDLDASIRATVDLRSSLWPDPRVHSVLARQQRDLSVLVLLDLSQSTNDAVPGTGITVLDLAREATALLADAMERIGDNFAIHGFSSNGRHDVGYYRVKDFDRPYGEVAKSRLAGMTGQLSTRMGTALRHSGSYLKDRRAHRRLVLLITDGEPSDIDVPDSQYLVFDAREAVEGLSRQGIYTYCMSLDPKGDRYVSRIFGVRNWTVVDRLRSLPEKLPFLYMRLTH